MAPPAGLPEEPPVDDRGVPFSDPQALDMERMASTANPESSNFRMGTSSFGLWRDQLLVFISLLLQMFDEDFSREIFGFSLRRL
jgi:hypothetical protein